MKTRAIAYALLAALLYSISIPLSKLLMESVSPYILASALYLGAGLGMLILLVLDPHRSRPEPIARQELPFVIGMIVLDIAAPLFLLFGVSTTHPANASLLNNFEIVATSIIALILFGEKISKHLWLAIVLVTIASGIMSFDGTSSLSFSPGSALILAACLCWGLENNCTRQLSHRDSRHVVVVKGFGAGAGAALIAVIVGESLTFSAALPLSLILGFVAFGLSIDLYIRAQRHLGAAKTSAFYAVAPFFGVIVSFIAIREPISWTFWVGLSIMILATYVLIVDTIGIQHTHEHSHDVTAHHTHPDGLSHTTTVRVDHTHLHAHGSTTEVHDHSHEFSNDELVAACIAQSEAGR